MKLRIWVKCALYILSLYALLLLEPKYPVPVLIALCILLMPAILLIVVGIYVEMIAAIEDVADE